MTEQLKTILFDPLTGKVALALLALVLVFTVGRLLLRSVEHYVKDNDARYRARKAVSFVRYTLAATVLAIIFSERLAGLTVVFGVAGAGIAFALQEVIASVAGWMAISSGGFYSTGDRVQVGGIRGDVIDIGVLRTTVMEVGQWVNGDLYNGRIVKIANSFVFKEPVFNYSADFPFLWDEITLPVRYGSDWKAAKAMLVGVGQEVCEHFARRSRDAWNAAVVKYRLDAAAVDPVVTMIATDNWLEFTLRYVVDYRGRRAVKDRLFTRILEEVDKSENRIRIASATFELVNLPRLDVDMAERRVTVAPKYVP
ncbi:MAG: mechanosensitive ion channel [Polyangiaceae bacterium]